ncbi:MAG: hypothetical protein HOW97_11925 [Catenulispora sp.]|nr:hypothetical protein [Catenulispora sp.]
MTDEQISESDEMEDEEEEEEPPSYVAVCPISPELAAQIVAIAELDWEDYELTQDAMAAAGWKPTGDYLGDLGEKCYTPAGHLVYGDDLFAMPFAYDYWIHPDGVWTDNFWADQPGWHTLLNPPPFTFEAEIDKVVAAFTELLGPPDHDVTHEPRPEFRYRWRYRMWRCGGNVLIISPGLDPHSYSQFEHASVQIKAMPADAPFPSARELPSLLTW